MPWTATVTSGSSWLAITLGASGNNSGTITCSFTANAGATFRTATIRVVAAGATGSPVDLCRGRRAAAEGRLDLDALDRRTELTAAVTVVRSPAPGHSAAAEGPARASGAGLPRSQVAEERSAEEPAPNEAFHLEPGARAAGGRSRRWRRGNDGVLPRRGSPEKTREPAAARSRNVWKLSRPRCRPTRRGRGSRRCRCSACCSWESFGFSFGYFVAPMSPLSPRPCNPPPATAASAEQPPAIAAAAPGRRRRRRRPRSPGGDGGVRASRRGLEKTGGESRAENRRARASQAPGGECDDGGDDRTGCRSGREEASRLPYGLRGEPDRGVEARRGDRAG